MKTTNSQQGPFPVVAVGALSAALATGLGLAAAAVGCRWSVGANGADWWNFACMYVNQAMVVVWLLVLPSLMGGQPAGAAAKSTASSVGLSGAVWLAAAAAAVPAFIWSAWISHIAWVNICTLLLAQGAIGVFSMAAGAWLHRVSATVQVYVTGLLGAVAIGGPILIYLQAEFLPNSPLGWRWFIPAFQIMQAAQTVPSRNLFWGIAFYGLCGVCGLAAAVVFGPGPTRSAASQ